MSELPNLLPAVAKSHGRKAVDECVNGGYPEPCRRIQKLWRLPAGKAGIPLHPASFSPKAKKQDATGVSPWSFTFALRAQARGFAPLEALGRKILLQNFYAHSNSHMLKSSSETSATPFPEGDRLLTGFGLIETVIGSAIIGAVLLGLAQVGQFAFRTVDESNLKLRAAFIAEEGIEAARILRDSGWAANISPLALDTDYFLTFSGGVWQLGQTPVAPLDNVFDRRLRFSAVYRGANDAITESGGTFDPNTKKLTVTVSWSNRGRTANTTIATYLTNLFSN